MRATHRIVITSIAALAMVVSSVASAAATGGGLEFLSSFNGSDNPSFPSGFNEPEGLAVDQATHRIYVADGANEVVDIFNAAGKFESQLESWSTGGKREGKPAYGVAVNNATGDAYVAVGGAESGVFMYNSAGTIQSRWNGSVTPSGTFGSEGSRLGVAVDNSPQPSNGEVYVLDGRDGVVDRLSTSGSPVEFSASEPYIQGSQLTGTPEGPFKYLASVAVSSINGDIYVGSQTESVAVFSPSGEYLFRLGRGTIGIEASFGIASDAATGSTYVSEARYSQLYVLDAAGALQYELVGLQSEVAALHGKGGVRGVGVDEETGDVYVEQTGAQQNGDVLVFRPGPLPAAPDIVPASAVTGNSATLHGDLNPEGANNSYYFSYGKGASCIGKQTPTASAGSGTSEVQEETTVTGLEPLTEYSFCFYTTSGQTVRNSSSLTFTTPAAKPVVDDQPLSVTGIGHTEATLHGMVNPNNQDTTYYFRYGLTAAYGSTSTLPPGTDIGAAFGDQHVSDELMGLMPETTYHYQLVAINAAGESESSPDESFTTLVPSPAGSTGGVSEVIYDAATVSGTVTPNGSRASSDTRWCFEYGTIGGSGYDLGSVPLVPGDAGTGMNAVAVSQRLTGLAAGGSYRYRLVAVNSLGLVEGGSQACDTTRGQEADGAEGTFTTPVTLVPPAVVTGGASGVSQNGATLSGTVDADGSTTNYAFELGIDTSYGVKIYGEAGSGSEAQSVSLNVGGLQPGTTYHYRLVASSDGGSVYGADETFTTLVFPTAAIAAPLTEPLVAIPDFTFPVVPAEVTTNSEKASTAKKTARKRRKPRRRRGKGSPKRGKAGASDRGHTGSRRGKNDR